MGMTTVGIVDLGICNLRSVQQALRYVGAEPVVLRGPDEVRGVPALILPGVGAFSAAVDVLRGSGFSLAITEFAASGRPLLGICLGMQLLASSGEEGGAREGLGILPGHVRRFPPGVRVPHVGWNRVWPSPAMPLFKEVPDGEYFYFVHSYCMDPGDPACVAAVTDYCGRFCSAVSRSNVYGVQFHPEKSSRAGLKVLSNFLQAGR